MKTTIYLLAAAALLCFFPRCTLTDYGDLEGGNFAYPLRIGNSWVYKGEMLNFNYRTYVNGELVPEEREDTLTIFTSRVEITGRETIPNALQAFVLEETYTEPPTTMTSYNYYNNTNRGLTFFAYRNVFGNPHIPKLPADGNGISSLSRISHMPDFPIDLMMNLSTPTAGDDELILEKPPILSLPKNLEEDTQWTYRHPGSPWRIDKRVLGKETIELPFGSHECYKIQWLFDIDNSGTWDDNIIFYDYIGNEGLLVRDIIFLNNISYDPTGMEPTGYFDSRIYSVVTNISPRR
jgi:hypothetical protein